MYFDYFKNVFREFYSSKTKYEEINFRRALRCSQVRQKQCDYWKKMYRIIFKWLTHFFIKQCKKYVSRNGILASFYISINIVEWKCMEKKLIYACKMWKKIVKNIWRISIDIVEQFIETFLFMDDWSLEKHKKNVCEISTNVQPFLENI